MALGGSVTAEEVERDVVAVRSQLDYPSRDRAYHEALEALDRLATLAHDCERLR